MAIKEIPKSYQYICDSLHCKGSRGQARTTHLQENANGYYTNSTPTNSTPYGWVTIKLSTNVRAEYNQKEALICPDCWDGLKGTLSHVMRMPGEKEINST